MTALDDLPLAGFRILSLEQFGAGPFGTLQLADLGAEVIKVEDAAHGGDVARAVPPFRAGETSLYFEAFNRGKRSIELDLRSPDGHAAFARLVPGVDAVFSNLRGDQPARLGLRYEDLRELNPRIVCCSLSGFGMTGPRAASGAYDPVIQALAGWMSLTGEPDAPPTRTGLSLVDYAGGYVAAIALLAGLLRAQRTGRGCDCDISLFETALALLTYVGTWTASRPDYEPQRTRHSAHPSIVPFQALPAADGWLAVACAKERLWRSLCAAIGRGELASDPRYADFAARDANRAALLDELYRIFAQRTVAEWVAVLEAAGVPCAPVNDVRAALRDPQAVARGVVQEIRHDALGTVAHLASPLRISTGVRPPTPAPAQGADTEAILGEPPRQAPASDHMQRAARSGGPRGPAGRGL